MKIICVIIIILCVSLSSAKAQSKQYYSKSTPLLGHVIFSQDGSKMFTWNDYGGTLWDAMTGAKIGNIENEYVDRSKFNSIYDGNYSFFDRPVISNSGMYIYHRDLYKGMSIWNTKRQIVVNKIRAFEELDNFKVADIDDDFKYIAFDSEKGSGSDGTRKIKLYDIQKREIIKEKTGIFQHKNEVTSIHVNSQHNLVISGDRVGAVHVWNYNTDNVTTFINSGEQMTVDHCTLNKRGDRVLVFYLKEFSSIIGAMAMFDVNTGERLFYRGHWGVGGSYYHYLRELNAHIVRLDTVIDILDVDSGGIISFSVADDSSSNRYEMGLISSDKKLAATMDDKCTIRIYDVQKKQRIQTIQLNPNIIGSKFSACEMVFNPSGNELVFTSDRVCYRFDILSGKLIQEIHALYHEEVSAEFMQKEGYLYLRSKGNYGYVYDLNNHKYIFETALSHYNVNSYNRRMDVVAIYNNHTDTIVLYNASTSEVIQKMKASSNINYSVLSIKFNEIGNHIMVFFADGSVQILDVKNGTYLYTLKLANGGIEKVVYTKKNNRCLVMSNTEAVMYNVNTGSKVATIPDINSYSKFSVNDVGDRVMTSNRIYNGNTGGLLKTLTKANVFEGESYKGYGILLNDGKTACTAKSTYLFFWDIESGDLLRKLLYNEKYEEIAGIGFTDDDKNYIIDIARDIHEGGSEIIVYDSENAAKIIYGISALRPFTSYEEDLLDEKIITLSGDKICRVWSTQQNISDAENEIVQTTATTNNFSISPNPTASNLRVSLLKSVERDTPFSVYTILGEKIYNGTVHERNNYYDVLVENWQQGTYFIEIHENDKRFVQQFYITR